MDLFHFDTDGLTTEEVAAVFTALQRCNRIDFVKLPWDRKSKKAAVRLPPSVHTQAVSTGSPAACTPAVRTAAPIVHWDLNKQYGRRDTNRGTSVPQRNLPDESESPIQYLPSSVPCVPQDAGVRSCAIGEDNLYQGNSPGYAPAAHAGHMVEKPFGHMVPAALHGPATMSIPVPMANVPASHGGTLPVAYVPLTPDVSPPVFYACLPQPVNMVYSLPGGILSMPVCVAPSFGTPGPGPLTRMQCTTVVSTGQLPAQGCGPFTGMQGAPLMSTVQLLAPGGLPRMQAAAAQLPSQHCALPMAEAVPAYLDNLHKTGEDEPRPVPASADLPAAFVASDSETTKSEKTYYFPPAGKSALPSSVMCHSRQGSSSSSGSDELTSEMSSAFGKVYERRNKKRRPAGYYQRFQQPQASTAVPAAILDRELQAGAQVLTVMQYESAAAEKDKMHALPSAGEEPPVMAVSLASSANCLPSQLSVSSAVPTVFPPQTAAAPPPQLSAAILPRAAAPSSLSPPAPHDLPAGDEGAGPPGRALQLVSSAQTETGSSSKQAAGTEPTWQAEVCVASKESMCTGPARKGPSMQAEPGKLPTHATAVSAAASLPAAAGPMSWAQRVQASKAATPQYQHSESAVTSSPMRDSARAAEQPIAAPPSSDLGALLAAMELSSSPSPVHPRGFVNKGNWCYVNATLQALLSCPLFFNFLSSLPKDPALCAAGSSKTPLLDALVALCNEFTLYEALGPSMPQQPKAAAAQPAAKSKQQQLLADLKPGSPFEPTFVSRMVETIWPSGNSGTVFALGKQEDAEEFLTALLNKVHEETMAAMKVTAPHRSPAGVATAQHLPETEIHSLVHVNGDDDWERVGPKNKHVITRTANLEKSPVTSIFGGKLLSSLTLVGASKTANIEPFLAVPLDIQPPEITSVFKALTALAKKEVIDGYTCSKTRQEIETHRRLVFEELPLVLILHLKCFVYDKNGLQKIIKKVDFGEKLEFSNELLSFPGKYSGPRRSYKLFAVVHHSGVSATGGHYTTDAFHSGVNCWVRYDDSNISIVSSQSVFEFVSSRVPYLLYYQRVDTLSAN